MFDKVLNTLLVNYNNKQTKSGKNNLRYKLHNSTWNAGKTLKQVLQRGSNELLAKLTLPTYISFVYQSQADIFLFNQRIFCT